MLRSFALILACCLTGAGVVSAETNENTAAKPEPVLDVYYTQIIRPGAAKEFAGKTLRFDALFFNLAVSNSDLPEKFQDGVRLILCAQTQVNSCEGVYANALMAKSKSAALRELKNGDQVRITAVANKFVLPVVRKPAARQTAPAPVSQAELQSLPVSSETARVMQEGKLKLAKLAALNEVKPQTAAAKPEDPNEGLILQVESIEAVK